MAVASCKSCNLSFERLEAFNVLGGAFDWSSAEVAHLVEHFAALSVERRGALLGRLCPLLDDSLDWDERIAVVSERLVRHGIDPRVVIDGAMAPDYDSPTRSWAARFIDLFSEEFSALVGIDLPQAVGIGLVRAGVPSVTVVKTMAAKGLPPRFCDVFVHDEVEAALPADATVDEVSQRAEARVAEIFGIPLEDFASWGEFDV